MTPTPHDALFKATYSDPRRAAAHLAVALPASLVERLDLDTLRLLPGSYLNPALKASASDLLFEVNLRSGGIALVYLLFEHQSTPDARMALRLFLYMARIWERWLAEHPQSSPIPAIVPLVLYHGERPWQVPLELAALFDLPEGDRPAFAEVGASLRYLLRDLSKHADADLQARAQDAMDLLVQLLLKHHRDDDLLVQLARWADVWRAVADGPGLRALAHVLSYIVTVKARRADEEALHRLLVDVLGPQGEEVFVSWLDEVEARGEARGKALGEARGQQRMLLNLLRQRFGEPTAEVVARVQAATLDELADWSDAFFRASSAEALVGLTR